MIAFLLFAASSAHASAAIQDNGYYRLGTAKYYTSSFPGCVAFSSCCTGANCTDFGTTNGAQVNTSDFSAGQEVYISQAADGEAFTFQAVAPDKSIWGRNTLTYTASTQCFTWSGDTSDMANLPPPNLGSGSCVGPYVFAWSGPTLPCTANGTALAGAWTLQVFDSASTDPTIPVIIHTFQSAAQHVRLQPAWYLIANRQPTH